MTASTFEVPQPARYYTEPLRLEVPGATIAYRRSGSGEPVLFLHGHWLTRRWLPFHEQLAAAVDVIAPEHPGFGESPRAARVTGRDDLVLLYRDVLDALTAESVHVVGYGLGGWLAAELAIWFPTRVRSLSLLAPFGLRVPGHPIRDVFILDPATYADTYYNGDGAAFDDLVPGVGSPAAGGVEEFAQRYGEMGSAAQLMWQPRYDVKLDDRLPRLAVPSLVVAGDDDRVVPAEHTDRWAELLGARTATVHGGHAFVVQSPEQTAETVAAFVQEVSR
jgi:pimeloyl-ACP methyl ester carboxylesterase